MRWRRRGPGATRWRQGDLPFRRRAERRDRAFKAAILASTALVVVAMIAGTSAGRYAAASLATRARWATYRALGMYIDRAEVAADRHRARLRGVEQTRRALADRDREGTPEFRRFLRAAGMAPDSAVIRWGNYDWSLALSSLVFEPDDAGRSYRLRPRTRSTWLINLNLEAVRAMFEIPDTPEARRLGAAIGGTVVPGAEQATNSWGCRGREPDPEAAVRGIVLGDSNMQGLLVGDDETPPARLEARLRRDLGVPVSILNAGVLGYSLEQYYYSLIAFHDRLRPRFVVVSVCSNDLGNLRDPARWDEARDWLDAITQFCRSRGVLYLIVPVPAETDLIGHRDEALFPGPLSHLAWSSALFYLNPLEEFTTEHLRLRAEAKLRREPFSHSPLFNGRYGDNHFSPLGSDLWAALVARRLQLIWASENPGGTGPLPPPTDHEEMRGGSSRRGPPGPP